MKKIVVNQFNFLITCRFRHPLSVPDMEAFAAPNPYGFAGSYYGTPERYEMNRYAYRLRPEEAEEPEAAALRAPSQEEAELQQAALEDQPVVYRRSGSYMTRSKSLILNYFLEKLDKSSFFFVKNNERSYGLD